MWGFVEKMRKWFRMSPHIHVRQHGVDSVGDLVDLIDRFIDDRMNYDLEWDDFISWKHDNHFIENVRQTIGAQEQLLFSKDKADRAEYVKELVHVRNRAAALIGLPPRKSVE
jgi:hypothetical protein